MQEIKVDEVQELENMTFCLLQNILNTQHLYMRSSILVVTLQAALKNNCNALQKHILSISLAYLVRISLCLMIML